MSTTDPSTHGRKPSASLRNELRNSGFPLSSRCNDDAVDSIAMITFAYDTSGGKDSDKKCATSSETFSPGRFCLLLSNRHSTFPYWGVCRELSLFINQLKHPINSYYYY
jgi:hypothetical protein